MAIGQEKFERMRLNQVPVHKQTLWLTVIVFALLTGATALAVQDVKPPDAAAAAKAEKERLKAEEKARKEAEKKAKAEAAAAGKQKKTKEAKIDTDANRGAAPLVMKDDLEVVHATVETDPVPHAGDAADDPAIWVNPENPALSAIVGTDKAGGIAVYDLDGKQLQYLPDGLMDNVDLRTDFPLGGQKAILVTASNRKDNSIAMYRLDPATRQLTNVAARVIKHGMNVYGMCMYRSAKTGKFYYFGNSKSGVVEQYELLDNGSGRVDAKKVRTFKVGTVVEGCVADDELGFLYISEEFVGIWKYGAEPDAGDTRTSVGKTNDGHLHADVEGLGIAYGPNGTGYLVASSQGNYSYVVYRREGNNEFVKKFRIGDGAIDGAEETDGLDVTAAPLGDKFPKGVLVVHDGFNDKGAKNQNYKLVPLEAIIK
jgi:3-phytase